MRYNALANLFDCAVATIELLAKFSNRKRFIGLLAQIIAKAFALKLIDFF